MDRRDRTFLNDPDEEGPVLGIELGGYPRRRNVDQPIRASLVEADHPIPQRLPVHPTDFGGLLARSPVEHRRDRSYLATGHPESESYAFLPAI